MLELVPDNHSIPDPLVACVETVLEFHRMRTDLAGLVAELPISGPIWSMADLPAVAEHLDLSLRIIKSDAQEISKTLTPIILPLADSRYAVVMPAEDGQHDFLLPGQAPTPLTAEHLESWIVGRVIVLIPKHGVTGTDTNHMSTDRSIDWFWHPIKKYTPNFGEVIMCTVFINLLVIALPLFTLNVYDAVVPNLAMSTLTVLALGVGIAIFFDVVLKTARSSTLERIAARTGVQFDSSLMQRMLSVREEEMQLSVGERCNLFRELQGLRDFYATKLVPALVDFPFFLFFLFVIYLISPVLMLVPIGVAAAILLLNIVVQIPVKRSTKALFSSMQDKSSMMVEMLTGSIAIKQLNASGTSLNRWNITSEQAAEAARISQRWLSFGQHGSMGLMQANHVLIVVVGVYQIQAGSLTVGGLVAATILASRTIAPVMNLHSVIARWTQSRDCLKTIDELFTRDVDRIDSKVTPGESLTGAIRIRDFSYNYPDQSSAAVKSVNLSIRAGENLCLIGPSGAGKSTLARAIAGALTPTAGQISIDGYDYQGMTSARLRANIALIPQHPFFVAGTVRDNLLLGIKHCTDAKIANATKLAGVDLVLSNSGAGLDTEVGENGRNLSGGQKQAVSIARAILRDTRILVFDEPTNGLDSALESHFMKTMKEFSRDRTLIMVTHRMSLVSLVDRVVVMDKGAVVADDKAGVVMKRFSA
jgi:ATP-binding cassette subfamily C protein LapB